MNDNIDPIIDNIDEYTDALKGMIDCFDQAMAFVPERDKQCLTVALGAHGLAGYRDYSVQLLASLNLSSN